MSDEDLELIRRAVDVRRGALPEGERAMKLSNAWPLLLLLSASGCDRAATPSASSASPRSGAAPAASAPQDRGGAEWLLAGSNDERFARTAKHLRGFDVAMAETAYRYAELYWAGKDRNWGYADYQLHKIVTAVANGVERRPRRAASARMLDGAVSVVKDAISKRDGAAFDAAFATLTDTCNACHQAERVGFVHVAPPPVRTSVVSPPAEPAP